MATDDRNGSFPDISGVFDINDSEVPTNIILKKQPDSPESAAARAASGPVLFRQTDAPARRSAAEPRRAPAETPGAYTRAERPAAREPVLLRQSAGPEDRKAQKLAQEERQRARRERQQRQRRAAAVRLGAIAGAAVLLLIVILAVALRKPTPEVLVERVKEASVEASFSVPAALIQDPLGTEEERLYAVAPLSPEEAQSVREGGKVTLAYPDGKTVTGVVYAMPDEPADAPLLETLAALLPDLTVPAGGMQLAVVLPDDPAAVAGGDLVDAQLVTAESKQVLTVPRNALRSDGASSFVWIFESGGASKKLARRTVKTGLLSDTTAEITDGLEKGEIVVVGCTLAPEELKDGMKVRLAKTE